MKREEFENLRNMSVLELQQKKNDIAKKLFDGRLQVRLGQLKNYSSLNEMRKDIARINNIMRYKQIVQVKGSTEHGKK
ncbi:MAG: 50S ribosomal protein L29 [Candidatus Omnitrophica bacterium]|nr:50S ribosomal protein L29 [Candidatus Omnitrophota bacterium]